MKSIDFFKKMALIDPLYLNFTFQVLDLPDFSLNFKQSAELQSTLDRMERESLRQFLADNCFAAMRKCNVFIFGDCADNLLYPPTVNVANKTVDKFVPLTVCVMRDLSA